MDIIEKLKSLEEESRKRGIPIIGCVKGQWLYERVLELRPKKVLELGTANGYSGLILTDLGAELVTIEQDYGIAQEAHRNFAEYGRRNINVINGDANQVVKDLEGEFDLIYIDHVKSSYLKVLGECIRLCRKGGVIIADNISFEGCRDFKEKVKEDSRLETEIVDIGDGLSLSVKL